MNVKPLLFGRGEEGLSSGGGGGRWKEGVGGDCDTGLVTPEANSSLLVTSVGRWYFGGLGTLNLGRVEEGLAVMVEE